VYRRIEGTESREEEERGNGRRERVQRGYTNVVQRRHVFKLDVQRNVDKLQNQFSIVASSENKKRQACVFPKFWQFHEPENLGNFNFFQPSGEITQFF
jgi:hypothetical protein